ncbi:VTC domain-containing protein [Gorgonomyces haynaldii]|nr:VTC domain-containing protein [Gorgonomyces haynaldii]
MNRVTAEISELSKFLRLNYSAFVKIVKKHDKHNAPALKPLIMDKLNAKPFFKLSFDSLIIRLSKLYDTVRTGGKRQSPPPPMGTSFVRRTTKYWVHPDNVTEVKIHILKHLPVLVFGKEPDPAITSIYFDNDAFELYQGRLEKSQGAQAVRLRWYGNMSQNQIFVERKTHHEDWTGESSVKERFMIKEKHVNEYLKGEYTMDHTIEKMRQRKQKPDKELDAMLQLSREVQDSIQNRGLKPAVRTFYNRTAFQLPGDARVRISLDTELTMIREDNYGKKRSGDNWRRTDCFTTAPFDYLPEEDVCNFPYAVLEVKLQTQHGTQAPQWVQDLINSHLVEEVPKFSKFIHGVATLLESKISLLPFWFPQMDKDIRKPVAQRLVQGPSRYSVQKKQDEIQVVVDDDADEKTPLLKKDKGKEPAFLKGLGEAIQSKPSHANDRIPQEMNQKRIILPVRVEPKVFFANERTFLSWLHFCIVLGGLALGLLNFGDQVAQISGLIFTVVSMIFMLYALFLYQWRAHKIRMRGTVIDFRFSSIR